MLVGSIPCRPKTEWKARMIRVYQHGYEPRVAFRAAITAAAGTRIWGGKSTNIKSAVASLLRKLKLENEEESEVAEALKLSVTGERAVSHKSDPVVKHQLKKVGPSRLCPGYVPRRKCPDRLETFEYIQGGDVPAMSHTPSAASAVKFIHQVDWPFKDTDPSLFGLSSSAWKAYATRNQCQYKLWTHRQVEALIQLEAPAWVQTLCRDVRYPVQRADVARFFICLLYTSPSPRDLSTSRMPSSA